jgi:hypothetical protein
MGFDLRSAAYQRASAIMGSNGLSVTCDQASNGIHCKLVLP